MTAFRKLRTREIVPREEAPNFRDHGKMVDRALLKVIGSLQKKHGEAFASEAGLRRMICEDTGHMPGVDTIPTALERLERQGVVEQRWLKPGGVLPDGSPCTHGTRLVFLPQCRHDRRALRARANRREGVTNRVDRRALETFTEARATIAKHVAAPDNRQQDADRKRREDLARLAELDARGFFDKPGEKPPD